MVKCPRRLVIKNFADDKWKIVGDNDGGLNNCRNADEWYPDEDIKKRIEGDWQMDLYDQFYENIIGVVVILDNLVHVVLYETSGKKYFVE